MRVLTSCPHVQCVRRVRTFQCDHRERERSSSLGVSKKQWAIDARSAWLRFAVRAFSDDKRAGNEDESEVRPLKALRLISTQQFGLIWHTGTYVAAAGLGALIALWWWDFDQDI